MPYTSQELVSQQSPPVNNTYGQSYGGSQGQYQGNSYRGQYANLPPGAYNAGGGGQDSAYMRGVQGNELVSQQLTGLLAYDSPYIQQARQQAQAAAASRGTLNSSMAAGNAQAAAIQAGLPIAQADAGAYGQAASQNQEALNAILAARMGNEASMSNARTAAGASRYGSHQGYLASVYGDDSALQRQRENLAFSGEQQGLDRGFRDYLERMGYGHQDQRDARQQAFNIFNANNDFNHRFGLDSASDPFRMQNPDGMQGYMDMFNNYGNSSMSDLTQYSNSGYTPYGYNPYGGYGNGNYSGYGGQP